jgi:hypothetical protein
MKTIIQAVVTSLAFAAVATAAPGQENRVCESQSPGGDFVQFSCPLRTVGIAQQWRFEAFFSGGHDDTSASMSLTLDGAPLDCEEGSKTRLFAEDGDVSLMCRFHLRGVAGERLIVGVDLLWSHAQYVRTELVAE